MQHKAKFSITYRRTTDDVVPDQRTHYKQCMFLTKSFFGILPLCSIKLNYPQTGTSRVPSAHCCNCSQFSRQLAALVLTVVDGTVDHTWNVLITSGTFEYFKDNPVLHVRKLRLRAPSVHALAWPDLSILLIGLLCGLLCADCMTESVIIHAGKGKTY